MLEGTRVEYEMLHSSHTSTQVRTVPVPMLSLTVLGHDLSVSSQASTDRFLVGRRSSNAWIAGTVAGPVAGITLFFVGVFLFQRHRRLQRQRQKSDPIEEEKFEKTQLHGDSLLPPNPIFEMDAEQEWRPQEIATVERAQELNTGDRPQSDDGETDDHHSASQQGDSSSERSVGS